MADQRIHQIGWNSQVCRRISIVSNWISADFRLLSLSGNETAVGSAQQRHKMKLHATFRLWVLIFGLFFPLGRLMSCARVCSTKYVYSAQIFTIRDNKNEMATISWLGQYTTWWWFNVYVFAVSLPPHGVWMCMDSRPSTRWGEFWFADEHKTHTRIIWGHFRGNRIFRKAGLCKVSHLEKDKKKQKNGM